MSKNRNFYRLTIQGLLKKQKPFIISAKYVPNQHTPGMLTFIDIRPYIDDGLWWKSSMICDHININEELIAKYISFGKPDGLVEVVMVCKAYIYADNRGGITLDENFKRPIQFKAEALITEEMRESCIDWFEFAEGRYAWRNGERKWSRGHKIRTPKTTKEGKKKKAIAHQNHERKEKTKAKRKVRQYCDNLDNTYDKLLEELKNEKKAPKKNEKNPLSQFDFLGRN